MKVSEILKGLRQRQDPKNIVEVFVCPLCLTRYKTKEEAEKCLSKGVPSDTGIPDVKAGQIIEGKTIDFPHLTFKVSGFGTDPSHKRIVAFIKIWENNRYFWEEITWDDCCKKRNPQIIKGLKNSSQSIQGGYICPLCDTLHSFYESVIDCLNQSVPELENVEINLALGDQIPGYHKKLAQITGFCLSPDHEEIHVKIRPKGEKPPQFPDREDRIPLVTAQELKALNYNQGKK